MKKGIIEFIIAGGILALIMLLNKDDFCEKKIKLYVKPMFVRDIVIKKYIDSSDHALPRILLSNNKYITAYDIKNFDSLYYYLEIGDSIIKNAGDSIFYVKRDTTIVKFAIGCY